MNNFSKKKLINKLDNRLTILIILLIIFFFNSTNFFKNFVKVTKKNYDERIIETYGFCGGESIGFLKYLKNKYKFNENPKIINYEHTPQVYWSIVNTKNINAIAKEKILLNYPGKQLNINLEKINDNLFEFLDLFFFSNNFDKLDKVIIKNNLDINFKLLIYTKSKSNLKKIVKIIDITSKSVNDLNIKFDNFDLNETRLFFEIQEKKITQNNIEINLILENKYIFEETEIIEKFNNCYYIK